MTNSLFSNDTAADHDSIDNTKNYLEELVGEGKKFKTPEDLARGKAEADAFIARLTREQQALREELAQRQRMEELLAKLENPQHPPASSQDNQDGERGEDPTKSVKLEDLEDLIEKKVSQRERERAQLQNLETVKTRLREAFGSDYATKLTQVATDLGLDTASIDKMAREQPKALLRLVGAEGTIPATPVQAPSLFAPPRGSQGIPGGTGPTVNEHQRNQAYYNKLKAQNPTEYWSPKVQNQLHQDAIRLGEAFFV